MDAESKAKAWFGKIFNKLEKIVVELDTKTAQNTRCSNSSDLSESQSDSVEPNKVAEDSSSGTCNHARVALPSSDPPSHQNFEISRSVGVQGDSLKENLSATSLPDEDMISSSPLLEEYCDGSNLTTANTLGDEELITIEEDSHITNTLNLSDGDPLVSTDEEMKEEGRVESCIDVISKEPPSTQSSLESFGTAVECNDDLVPALCGISTDDSNLNPIDKEIVDVPVQDNEANMRSSDTDIPDYVINGKSDAAPLDTNALHDINLNSIDTKIFDLPIQDNEANMRSSDADNPVDVINGKSDVAPLDTKALHDLAFREDHSYVDENALYAVHVRIKKLRSFKRKILDVLTSKRRREEEYEQLAIWFGDADMGFDLSTGEEESKPIDAEDYQWELL